MNTNRQAASKAKKEYHFIRPIFISTQETKVTVCRAEKESSLLREAYGVQPTKL